MKKHTVTVYVMLLLLFEGKFILRGKMFGNFSHFVPVGLDIHVRVYVCLLYTSDAADE